MKDNSVVTLFDIEFNNVTMLETLELMKGIINENKLNGNSDFLVTPNVDHIVNVHKNKEFRELYKKAKLKLVDGQPIIFASKFFKKPIKEKISGSDLTPEIFKMANNNKFKVFIFGSKPGVPEKAINLLLKKNQDINTIGFYSPPFGFENNEEQLKVSINKIKNFKPDILLVSLGSPKGEFFIANYLDELKVPLSIQVGASIDFIANTIPRAPIWMQKSGLEWLFRFLREPNRMFYRYFINDSYFVVLLFKEWKKRRGVNVK